MRQASRLALACLGLAILSATGCSILGNASRSLTRYECVDDFMLSYRNRAMAEKAWICRAPQYDKTHIHTFKEGFIAGYLDVASGGAGCCPQLAPRKYWGWRYQSPGGHDAVNAWFAGFPLGVVAAQEDGLGHYHHVRMNGLKPQAGMPMAPVPMQPMMIQEMPATIPGDAPAVTNPFYSDPSGGPVEVITPGEMLPEIIEAPQGIVQPPVDIPVETLQLDQPDSVFDVPTTDLPIAQDTQMDQFAAEPEMEEQLDIVTTHEAAVSARLGDQTDEVTESTETDDFSFDEIFGSSTPVDTELGSDSGSDSGELPFTFE